jgi:hypothetical protein
MNSSTNAVLAPCATGNLPQQATPHECAARPPNGQLRRARLSRWPAAVHIGLCTLLVFQLLVQVVCSLLVQIQREAYCGGLAAKPAVPSFSEVLRHTERANRSPVEADSSRSLV